MSADTNRPIMSAPTPETDNLARGNHVVPTEWAEQLEQERDEAREIAARLAHFLERPAYSVDEAIARMEALNSYKKLKSK